MVTELVLFLFTFCVHIGNADNCTTTECYYHGTCVNDESSTGYTCTCDDNYAGDDCEYYMNSKEASAELIFIILGSILFAPAIVFFCTKYKQLAGVEVIGMGADQEPEIRFSRRTIHTDMYMKARSMINMRDTYEPGGFQEAHSAIW